MIEKWLYPDTVEQKALCWAELTGEAVKEIKCGRQTFDSVFLDALTEICLKFLKMFQLHS